MTRVSLKGMTRRVPTLGGGAAPSTLLDGLAAYWTLDEAAGSNRADSVGSSTAVLNGTVGSVAGKTGNAANFNGNIDNYLAAANNAAINPAGTSWTLALWYKLNVNTPMGLMAKVSGSGGNEFIIDYGGGVMRLLFYGATTSNVTTSPTTIDTTNWYALRAWYDLPTAKIWIQSEALTAVSANAPVGGMNVSNGALGFGVFDGGSRPGNVALDSVGFWRRVLTDDEWTEFRAGEAYPF